MPGGTIAIGFAGNPNEPAAMRGGPMFEFLFGIDTLLRRQGRRQRFELVFFNPALRPAQRLGDTVPEAVLKMMAEKDIRTHLGHKMLGFAADKVLTEGGEISADDRKSTRLNSSHVKISYAVFCLKKKND